MNENFDFDAIRPYRDEEVVDVLKNLCEEEQFIKVIQSIKPELSSDMIKAILLQNKTVLDFQGSVILSLLEELTGKVTNGVELIGKEKISPDKAYLYITNHRDIVLDSAFLNMLLYRNKYVLTEIGIGDNLFVYDWIRHVAKLNRSFVVERNLPLRQQLISSARMSAYMRHTLSEKKQSMWIAQREGRAKNSDDRTQPALLKMLNMSGKNQFADNFKQLHICPISISYEYDPCDYLKAIEFQLKRDNPEYKKTKADDLKSMGTGIMGYKGKVCFTISEEIDNELDCIAQQTENKGEQINLLTELIDKKIHSNYTIFSNNKIAYDLLLSENKFATEYNEEEKQTFLSYIDKQLAKINIPNKDEDFLRTKILEMYANPLINHLTAKNA